MVTTFFFFTNLISCLDSIADPGQLHEELVGGSRTNNVKNKFAAAMQREMQLCTKK
jgi:hypothetical protein